MTTVDKRSSEVSGVKEVRSSSLRKAAVSKAKLDAKAAKKASSMETVMAFRGRPHTGLFTKGSSWWKALLSAEMTPYHPNEDFCAIVKYSHKVIFKETLDILDHSYSLQMRGSSNRQILITMLSSLIYLIYPNGVAMKVALHSLCRVSYVCLERYVERYKRYDGSIPDIVAYHRKRLGYLK